MDERDKPSALAVNYRMSEQRIHSLVLSHYHSVAADCIYIIAYIDYRQRGKSILSLVTALTAAREAMRLSPPTEDEITEIIRLIVMYERDKPADVHCVAIPVKAHKETHEKDVANAEAARHSIEWREWHIVNPTAVPIHMRSDI